MCVTRLLTQSECLGVGRGWFECVTQLLTQSECMGLEGDGLSVLPNC